MQPLYKFNSPKLHELPSLSNASINFEQNRGVYGYDIKPKALDAHPISGVKNNLRHAQTTSPS
jgi:hypothetical protein